jgi:hypothetical protein
LRVKEEFEPLVIEGLIVLVEVDVFADELIREASHDADLTW